MSILFKECVKKLRAEILPRLESEKVSNLFVERFPMTSWGKIDWAKIEHKTAIGDSPDKIVLALERLLLKQFDKTVYIEWSEGDVAVIETNIDLVEKHFDEVTCVACDKFIFNLNEGYIIEVLHLGDITVGKV